MNDPEDVVLVENLPMYLNLGDFGNAMSAIGWAKVTLDHATRQRKIEITLDEEASIKLGNLIDVFDLKAIGFAGIKRLIHERES